jgi:hypothetical protein
VGNAFFITDDAEWTKEFAQRMLEETKENYKARYDTETEIKIISVEVGTPTKVSCRFDSLDSCSFENTNSLYIDENIVVSDKETKVWGKETELDYQISQ